MWKLTSEKLSSSSCRYRFGRGDKVFSCAEIYQLWIDQPEFCRWFSQALGECGFPAYFWETPSVTSGTTHQAFECVLTSAPALAGTVADPSAFGNQFSRRQDQPVIAFENLGRDALLVIPCPVVGHAGFPHLAAFLSSAPAALVHELWKSVGRNMLGRISECPLWLSTAGLGVPWLHVRLDARPKYYRHAPYKTPLTNR